MIFLDTSGILALAMPEDIYHEQALAMMQSADAAGETLLIHNYVIVEAVALLQRRIGLEAALMFTKSTKLFRVVWVDASLHAQALNTLTQTGKTKLSLTDAVSFLVMRSQGCTEYIGFDKHFTEAGFRSYQARG
ncbi:MAG: type II toxin-antitoxin system VapC family toxin [Armatimonadota bacterium]